MIRELAERVLDGAAPEEIRSEIASLQTNSPLWKLRVNCLYYCRIVHMHHRIEDRRLFPALRQTNPALDPVVDRLEADHVRVGGHLDEVEAGVDELVANDEPENRQQLVDALGRLSEHLLAHLEYEEETILPTMRTWDAWPDRKR
jgi:iron-sulfur cluster repair protein YtfE (RIC family)